MIPTHHSRAMTTGYECIRNGPQPAITLESSTAGLGLIPNIIYGCLSSVIGRYLCVEHELLRFSTHVLKDSSKWRTKKHMPSAGKLHIYQDSSCWKHIDSSPTIGYYVFLAICGKYLIEWYLHTIKQRHRSWRSLVTVDFRAKDRRANT